MAVQTYWAFFKTRVLVKPKPLSACSPCHFRPHVESMVGGHFSNHQPRGR